MKHIRKRYKIEISDDLNDLTGVNKISIVKNPAIRSNFVKLSEDIVRETFLEESNERKMLYGAVLIPDLDIPRVNEFEEYTIFFDKKAIEKIALKFAKNKFHNSFNMFHKYDLPADKFTVVETWIKEDEIKDKSVKLGLDVPVGSLIVGVKIEDDKFWDTFIKTGELKGFSVEIFSYYIEQFSQQIFEEQKIENEKTIYKNKNNTMSKLNIFDNLLSMLRSKPTQFKFEAVKIKDSENVEYSVEITEGVIVSEPVPADGKYTLEDGTEIEITNGMVMVTQSEEVAEESSEEELMVEIEVKEGMAYIVGQESVAPDGAYMFEGKEVAVKDGVIVEETENEDEVEEDMSKDKKEEKKDDMSEQIKKVVEVALADITAKYLSAQKEVDDLKKSLKEKEEKLSEYSKKDSDIDLNKKNKNTETNKKSNEKLSRQDEIEAKLEILERIRNGK